MISAWVVRGAGRDAISGVRLSRLIVSSGHDCRSTRSRSQPHQEQNGHHRHHQAPADNCGGDSSHRPAAHGQSRAQEEYGTGC